MKYGIKLRTSRNRTFNPDKKILTLVVKMASTGNARSNASQTPLMLMLWLNINLYTKATTVKNMRSITKSMSLVNIAAKGTASLGKYTLRMI